MIYNVQTLRALAASLVVVTHLDTMLVANGIGREHLAFGTAGVDLFFVISGFVMVYTTTDRTIAPIAFLRDRLQRIAPLYYSLTLVVFVVALIAPGLLKSTTASVPDLIRSLLFIPYVKESGEVQPVLFLGWTLNYEMFFYAIFALSLLFAGSIRRVFFLSVIIGLLIVAGAFVPQPFTIPFFFTRPIMAEFVMGAWIGIAYSRGQRLPPALALACLLAGTFVLVGRFWLWPGGERAWWGGISSAAILIGALWMPEYRERLSQLIGGASYSLYLLHPFIIIAATRICVRLGLFNSAMGLFAAAVFAFALACVAAILSYLYVEKPVARFLKNRTDRRHIHGETAGV